MKPAQATSEAPSQRPGSPLSAIAARAVPYLLAAAIVLGIAVDGFFAIVNFYPVAPHPSRGPKRYVVMQLDEAQAAWFQANVLDDFNDEANANLQLLRVDDEEQIQTATADGAKKDGGVVLTLLPVTQVGHAIATKLVRPFAGPVSARQIAADFGDLGAPVLAPGKVDGAQYFLPGVARLDVAVFRVSKVRDAVLHWGVLRADIDAALKQINGHGLPAGYDLSLSPDNWNAYDVFVMAYYWAHRVYNGQPARPRVAHRTGDEIDGQQDITAALYRAGGNDETLGKFDSRAAIDFFQWEALFHAEGLYPAAMAGDEPFDDEAVTAGLKSGELFLAPLDSMEAFSLHGGAHAGATAQIDDPADLEFTSLPTGASLALDAKHHPQRTAATFSFREDWVWALPVAARAPQLAYDLVQFMWRPEIHARMCEALGMLPLHPEIVASRVSTFRLDWMRHVFEAGLKQAQRGEPVPPAMIGKGFGSIYAQLWAKIVAGGVPPVPESGIVEILHAPPAPKPLAVAAADKAEPDKPDKPDKPDEEPETVPPESADWENDVVLQRGDAGTAP